MTMKKLRLALEWFLNPDHVPLLIAQEEGFLDAVGLTLELVEPVEHFDAFQEMSKGTVDVAITEPIHLVQDFARGEQMIGFARFLHTNGGVMFFEDAGITRPREMAGKRLQYPGAPGPGGPAIVRTMIAADGGEPNAPIEPVNNGFQHTAAIVEGKADLATLVFYNFEIVEARHQGHAAHFFALKDWGVPDFCQLILICTPERMAEREADLRHLLSAIRRGIDFLHQHPDRAREIYMRRAGVEPSDALMNKIFDATVPCFTHDLSMSHEYYDRLSRWLTETGQVESGVSLDSRQIWTNALAL